MNILSLDVETTISNKGNSYDSTNCLVCYSYHCYNDCSAIQWTNRTPTKLLNLLGWADLILGFNFKFDAHWLTRHGISFAGKKIWDVQLAEFILSRQTNRFPSLNETCIKYGHPTKLDIIKEEFWERKCSCHVSIAQKIQNIMLRAYVGDAIVGITNPVTELNEHLIKQNGERITQNVKQLFLNGELKNYVLILMQRLEQDEQKKSESTTSQILITLDSWRKQAVVFAEALRTSALTTIMGQVKLEICCAYHVIQLWDILKNQIGLNGHTHTCRSTPVDTDKIPWEILSDYAAFDAHLTRLCYDSQIKLMTPEEIKLCRIQCEDMMILMEMEQNGLPFDEELCNTRSKELDIEIESLKAELKAIYPNVPINFGSNDHLSAFLYGGIVKEDSKEFVGYYKTGARANEPKYKNIVIEHQLPRLYTPLKGSEMAKEGNYSTNEGTLRKLKGKKGVLDKILHLSKLEKLNGTYYNGLVQLRKEMNWEPNVLHGQFNQTTAISGRLSSSKPNLQNFASDLQDIFISKYND